MSDQTHIAILGARPGGYVAALRAARLGACVTVLERDDFDGLAIHQIRKRVGA